MTEIESLSDRECRETNHIVIRRESLSDQAQAADLHGCGVPLIIFSTPLSQQPSRRDADGGTTLSLRTASDASERGFSQDELFKLVLP